MAEPKQRMAMHPLLEALSQGMAAGLPPVGGDPTKPSLTPQELDTFGNWTGQTDVKVMAADLMKRGLIGAGQLAMDNPNQNDPNSIINSQSDWKPAAIEKIVSNARRYNLRKPEELTANRDLLMNTLDPRIKDAISNPYFQQIHPNFWSIINNSIIPEQWAKFDAAQKIAQKGMASGTNVVKK